jgi:hypothetical protein
MAIWLDGHMAHPLVKDPTAPLPQIVNGLDD